jgi:hypothetical protein
MKIEFVSFPGCPNAEVVRDRLRACLVRLGLPDESVAHVSRADYPSPSILVDGKDVLGEAVACSSCRVALPSEAEIMLALGRAGRKQ